MLWIRILPFALPTEGEHNIASGIINVCSERRYVVDPACRDALSRELKILGVTESVAFPDLVGLAVELKERFLH